MDEVLSVGVVDALRTADHLVSLPVVPAWQGKETQRNKMKQVWLRY